MQAVDRALGIYIKGVSEETTEVDLQSTFSQFGLITETVIKGERGWALVQFADSAASAAALNTTDRPGWSCRCDPTCQKKCK